LTRNMHIKAMTTKAIQRFLALYSILKYQTPNSKMKTHLYKSLIRPFFLHGATAWGYASNNNMKKPQTIQNKILKIICGGDR
jgi:hypothetical protein